MNEEQYIDERVEGQIDWYSKKSSANKNLHYWTRGLVIIFSAIIPFLSGFLETGPVYLGYIVGVLGMLVALLTGVSSLVKFQEKWIKYRATSSLLKNEKFMYLTGSGFYKEGNKKFEEFVSRIENIMSKENSAWTEIMENEDD
ncbi:DUF4231 domain-containing protein [Aquimarina pacifica]|uniref:DUF4231 domain-containing protein n=1 Tax=Aquimarina pacifica TaxID=1296415 RepID=UPI00046FB203|nr:DUF4231 domain-containing protein [Aquimarina pacifica]